MKKSIIKDVALVIIGMLLVGVPVMAVSYIPSRDVSYKNEYNESVTNVEEALDTLTNQIKEINNTGTSLESDILSGKTAYVNGKLLTGSMANYSGATASASNITESGTNALITVPGGYYDDSSSISVPLNTVEELPTISSNLKKKVRVNLKILESYGNSSIPANWTIDFEISGNNVNVISHNTPDVGYKDSAGLYICRATFGSASASII